MSGRLHLAAVGPTLGAPPAAYLRPAWLMSLEELTFAAADVQVIHYESMDCARA